MSRNTKVKFIIKGILFVIVAGTVFTFALMLLWNWLMPLLFGLAIITFWQALGILALSKIIFGGGGHPGSRYHKSNRDKFWKERFQEKLEYAKDHHNCGHKKEDE